MFLLKDQRDQCYYIWLQVYSDSLLTNPLLFADDTPSFNNLQITPPTPIHSNSRDAALYKSEEDLTLQHQLSPEMFDQRRMSAPMPHQAKNTGLMTIPLNMENRRQSDPSAGLPMISISPTEPPQMGSLNNIPAHVTSPINSKSIMSVCVCQPYCLLELWSCYVTINSNIMSVCVSIVAFYAGAVVMVNCYMFNHFD